MQKDYASKQRDKWLKRVANEFVMLEGLFPFKSVLPKENGPGWVERVEQEYMFATNRGLDLKHATKLSPMRLGGFLGYQCAYAVWMVENLNAMMTEVANSPEKLKKAEELCKTEAGRKECENWGQALTRFENWYAALRRLAGRALKSCVYQPYEDMTAFLAGYSAAFARKPKLGAGMGDFGNSAFGIYHFMIFNWRVIERLDSVRALHELLRKWVGQHRTGDLKRVEKICQRIGLHFRKRGRPKKSK